MRTSDLLNELVQELDLSRDPLTYELGFESALNGIQALHGIECVYAILMDYVARSGATLSDAQMSHLDTCPLVQCRLVLRPSAASRSNSTLNLVNQFRFAPLKDSEETSPITEKSSVDPTRSACLDANSRDPCLLNQSSQ